MTDNNGLEVSIEIGTMMYARYADFPFSVSHTIAEFIDNALQSYRNNKDGILKIDPYFKFKVTIDFEWDLDGKAKEIKITDNAGGLNQKSFEKAFITAETPEDNTGLNEFGMGMKTAAGWLGKFWSVRSSAIDESVERFFEFDLQHVLDTGVKKLPYTIKQCPVRDHYTIVTISKLTDHSPTHKSLARLKSDLASIYRQSLRVNEMELCVAGEFLSFKEYPILVAPFVRTPDKKPVLWKKDIDFSFKKYKAKGFIAILRDINSTQNGLVLMRRGRVIVGANSDGRYFPKSIFGTSGNFRFKRLFGELELEGFDVSFNKDAIQNTEDLEALMEVLKEKIHSPEFDLYTQADEYRLDEKHKIVKKLVKRHDTSAKSKRKPIDISTRQSKSNNPSNEILSSSEDLSLGEYEDRYTIDGKPFSLAVQYRSSNGDNLFWIDVSKKDEGKIICVVDIDHLFFQHFGHPSDAITAILKTLAISKFTSMEFGSDTPTDMMNYFNQYIKETKV